jgi:hypothetical protein
MVAPLKAFDKTNSDKSCSSEMFSGKFSKEFSGEEYFDEVLTIHLLEDLTLDSFQLS